MAADPTPQTPPIGGEGCLCREIWPKDRPCLTCEARAALATTPVEPAFSLRSATVWQAIASYRIGQESLSRTLLVMSADPSGADVAQIVIAVVKADTPGAERVRLLRVECFGDVWGTAVVSAGRVS